MSRGIILNVKQEEINQKIPLICMSSPVTTMRFLLKKKKKKFLRHLTVDNNVIAVQWKRNPQGTADYTSNPGGEQIHTSLYFSWWELKVRKPKHAVGPRILLQKASDAIARNQSRLDHPFTVWLIFSVSSLYFVTTTVGLAL